MLINLLWQSSYINTKESGMKTLKQWFDSLSSSAQTWIEMECSVWFDKSQADYYRKPMEEIDKDSLAAFINTAWPRVCPSDITEVVKRYVSTLKCLANNYPEIISQDIADAAILEIINENISQKSAKLYLYLSDKNKKAGFMQAYGNRFRDMKLDLCYYLYLIDDFDNIVIDLEKCIVPSLTPAVIEIIGMDNARKIVKDLPIPHLCDSRNYGKANPLLDELLFCENSNFTTAQKHKLLARLYWDIPYAPDENMVQDFFKRVVAVDHSYLRYIKNIIHAYPGIAMKLYNQKKPKEELTGNETIAEQYRYNKEIRKLFVIAHACELKNITKTKASITKEIAPLIKIYGYNWNEIYDTLYPDDDAVAIVNN